MLRFGFKEDAISPDLFLVPGNIVRFGFPPNRIEIMNEISGVEFQACMNRCVQADFDGLQVPMISKQDLIANKRSSARYKDLADIEALGEDPS